jgi:type IV pilus assembly protein PilO
MKKIDTSKIIDPILKTIDKIGKLSKLYRMLISLGIILLFAGPLVYFSYLPKMNKIEELNNQIVELDNKLIRLKNKARQLKSFEKKLAEAEDEFKVVRRALPEKQEIPNLLASISQSGRDAGLEFILFQPRSEVAKDFYAEIPVNIQVTGNFHNLATFFDKISRLPRIVNVDQVTITTDKDAKDGTGLSTKCTAVTYRFIEKKDKKGK